MSAKMRTVESQRQPLATEETPRRLTPTERLTAERDKSQEIALAALTRPPRTGQESAEIGETAQGRPYVKSVQVYREDGETGLAMGKRALTMFAYLRANLPEYVEPAPSTKVVHVQAKAS